MRLLQLIVHLIGLLEELAVVSILLQVDMDTLGDLEEPAPLGLQSVHVGLEEIKTKG